MSKISNFNLINGIASDCLNSSDRSIHYGDGLFETVLCENDYLYFWPQHYRRLQASAEQLKMNCPKEQVLLDDITQLLQQIQCKHACAIKIILSRVSDERGYRFSKKAKINRMVFASSIETDYSSFLSTSLLSGQLYLCQQQVSINKNLAGIKHLNRLENVLARNEWSDGYIDGLMMNDYHHVIEGTMSNLFAVKDGQLVTPELTLSGVRGVMRDAIMATAKTHNIEVIVRDIELDELPEMDELFISNSLIAMKSVTAIGDTTYNKHDITNLIFNHLLSDKENHAQAV